LQLSCTRLGCSFPYFLWFEYADQIVGRAQHEQNTLTVRVRGKEGSTSDRRGFSIAGAFHMAGVPHSVSGMWQLDDTVAMEVGVAVFDELLRGGEWSGSGLNNGQGSTKGRWRSRWRCRGNGIRVHPYSPAITGLHICTMHRSKPW